MKYVGPPGGEYITSTPTQMATQMNALTSVLSTWENTYQGVVNAAKKAKICEDNQDIPTELEEEQDEEEPTIIDDDDEEI